MEDIYILERKHVEDLVVAVNNIEKDKKGVLVGSITQKIESINGTIEDWNGNNMRININIKYMATIRKTTIL